MENPLNEIDETLVLVAAFRYAVEKALSETRYIDSVLDFIIRKRGLICDGTKAEIIIEILDNVQQFYYEESIRRVSSVMVDIASNLFLEISDEHRDYVRLSTPWKLYGSRYIYDIDLSKLQNAG